MSEIAGINVQCVHLITFGSTIEVHIKIGGKWTKAISVPNEPNITKEIDARELYLLHKNHQ